MKIVHNVPSSTYSSCEMIALRPLAGDDTITIKGWPPYPPEFQNLDYALRDGGWIDEYLHTPGADILVADQNGKIVGFSVIAQETGGIAEIRVAVHPEHLGQGIGTAVMRLALAYGFSDPAIGTIRLIVRKNNPRAKRLYEQLHFRHDGECTEEIRGRPVEFFRMRIERGVFEGLRS